MKKIILILTLLVGCAGFAQFPVPYCGPMTFTSNVEPITLVNFAGINNTSSALVGADNGTTIIAHENYTAIIGNVTAGSTYPITLKGNTDGNYITYLRVYIDWNQNNVFTDAGESYDIGTIANSNGTDAIQLIGSIVVPSTALAGNTRMRVVKRFNVYGTSCQIGLGFGQTEDYSLTVSTPSCLSPSAGLSTVTSSTTANLSWTSGGAANAEIVVQAAGAGLPALANDTGVNVSGSTYSASSLLGQTAYEFYVRNECVIGSSFSTWSGPFLFNTTQIPGCATNLTPLDGATNISSGTVTFSWNAPTTGDPASSYDFYYGLTAGNATIFVDNFTTTSAPITITGFNTTFYWKVVPKNIGGISTGCPEWSFTTSASPGYCLSSPNGQWPTATYTPTTCDGITSNSITAAGYAGEFSVLNVTSGQTYKFASSVPTDFITISADAGVTASAFGTTPVTWIATLNGTVRFYTHTSDQCGAESVNRTRSVICGILSTDSPDFVNLQFPASATIAQGGNTIVYGQVYEGGLTDVNPNIVGQAPGITAWVGISPVGANTNPNTWTTWIPATWNAGSVGNNDEYQATIGATLLAGTYYYATRFQLNTGAYVYGGIDSSNNGNFWDGTAYLSGILTVNPPPTPANDECAGAIALTAGAVFADNAVVGTSLGATNIGGLTNTCNVNVTNNVWYSVIVPASGNITIETQADAGSPYTDSLVGVFSGNCSSLVAVGCDDDGGTDNFSLLSLTGQTPGATLFVTVWRFSFSGGGLDGTFRVSAYDGSLSNSAFDNANFTFYPNPVKNTLNLSYNQEISGVDIFNLLGQKIISTKVNSNSGQIDMSSLPKGAYMVKVTSNNQVKTIKVIKE